MILTYYCTKRLKAYERERERDHRGYDGVRKIAIKHRVG